MPGSFISGSAAVASSNQFAVELAQFEKATGVKLSEEQVAAVDLCVRHPVCILTGGAGRGKTMIVKAIIWILSARKQQCVLAAPQAGPRESWPALAIMRPAPFIA